MPITEEVYGSLSDGTVIKRFTLTGSKITVQVITLGGTVTSIMAPDAKGVLADVALGYDDLTGYTNNQRYFGVLVGRCANRIARGGFVLDGHAYSLAVNNGPNHLHGGLKGFDKKVWTPAVSCDELQLSLSSEDGDEGYPGKVEVKTTYKVTKEDELVIHFHATTDKATPVNLTNHAYFNLNGHAAGDIFSHVIELKADRFTPNDETSIPTGDIVPVEGTLYDLRSATILSKQRLEAMPRAMGFDNNFCLLPDSSLVKSERQQHVARLTAGGRVMDVYTTQPGIQFYTGYYLNNYPGKQGAIYNRFAGLCLETQNYPDAVNKPNFPSAILRPGEVYEQTTVYQFSAAS